MMLNVPVFLTFWFSLTSVKSERGKFAATMNPLATGLHWKMAGTESGNFLVSPCSLGYAILFIKAGDKHATVDQLMLDDLKAHLNTKKNTVRLVTKLYVNKHYTIKDTFKETAVKSFGAKVENIDFNKRTAAIRKMNNWIKGRTDHKIKDLVDTHHVNRDTVAILVNALYFKGNWLTRFKYTDKRIFFVNGRHPTEVETMHLTTRARYQKLKNINATVLELPFAGDEATFTIIVPHKKAGLTQIEHNDTVIASLIENKISVSRDVDLSLPKFKLETKIDLGNILSELGLGSIFELGSDLSGIAGEVGELKIDHLPQKSFISVNEAGVGTASGSMGVAVRSAKTPKDVEMLLVDRPFLFYIRLKGMMLFTGRVVNPEY